MALQGSILGQSGQAQGGSRHPHRRHPVLRRPHRRRCRARRVRAVDDRARHRRVGSTRPTRCRCPASSPSTRPTTCELADHHGFIDAAADVATGRRSPTGRCGSSATSSPRSSPRRKAQAVDAAEAVIVDYDPLPAVVDPEAALARRRAARFHDGTARTSRSSCDDGHGRPATAARRRRRRRHGPLRQPAARGRADGAERHRRGARAPTAASTAWVPTPGPHGVHGPSSPARLGLDPSQVRVRTAAVGGGFGAKAAFVRRVPRSRSKAALAARPAGEVDRDPLARTWSRWCTAAARCSTSSSALQRDGTITGLRCTAVRRRRRVPGDRRVPAVPHPHDGARACTRSRRSSSTWSVGDHQHHAHRRVPRRRPARGHAAARAHHRHGRRRARHRPGRDPPHATSSRPRRSRSRRVTGANYDIGEYAKALDAALAARRLRRAARRAGAPRASAATPKQLGIGVCVATSRSPRAACSQEYGAVEIARRRHRRPRPVGTSAHGQGHETAFAMIVSELLGVPMEKVRARAVRHRARAAGQRHGGLAVRCRSAAARVYRASEGVLDKAQAARRPPARGEPRRHRGRRRRRSRSRACRRSRSSWAELAAAANDPPAARRAWSRGSRTSSTSTRATSTFPFGAHVAVVEVDTETGRVELLRHVAVDDCGRILNPLLVAGQQHGGIAQGVAQALFEGVQYDDDGNPLTANLMDYAMPSAAELPTFEASNTETPTPLNPLGAKGIGESGTIGSTPAVQNAVVDALSAPRRPPHRHAAHRGAGVAAIQRRVAGVGVGVAAPRHRRCGSRSRSTR